MKRKFTAAAAGVLAASMMFGATAFAANSPSTKTTTVSNTAQTTTTTTESTPAAETTTPAYISRSSNGYQNVAGTRVEADYSSVSDKTVVATAAKAEVSAAVTQALDAYIATTEDAGKTTFGTYKVQMYKGGKSTWDGFGTFNFKVTVGSKYEGQTATVYVYHKDGTVSKLQVVVTKGKLAIPMNEMGTIKVLF